MGSIGPSGDVQGMQRSISSFSGFASLGGPDYHRPAARRYFPELCLVGSTSV